MQNPPYNLARGAAAETLELKPPFDFQGVTSRVFPLRANMHRLQSFCDAYLNLMPPEISYFRPFLPYVFLQVLDYGRMSSEIANLGWVSQHEVTFTIPLEWYRKENGRMVFQDWTIVVPFIYVDNPMSLRTGREVYGWPKVHAWFDPQIATWVENPRNPPRLASLSTMLYGKVAAGREQRPGVLLEIDQTPAPTFSQVPPDLGNSFFPLLNLPSAVVESFSIASGWLELMTRLPIRGYSPMHDGSGLLDPSRLLDGLKLLSGKPYSNVVTLKQFRDAELPHFFCYQAIVYSQMLINSYNAGGLLGDANYLRGDPTGGYRIRIHRHNEQPVIESLGLAVDHETTIEGNTVATLKPLFPYWMDIDMGYGVGYPVCWRARDSGWHPGASHRELPLEGPRDRLYNTARGAALQEMSGPFLFKDVTARVLPLMAEEARLQEFCRQYLQNDFLEFEAFGSYVYLVLTNYGDMTSGTTNLGCWAKRDLEFLVPVKFYRRPEKGDDPGDRRLLGLGLVCPFAYPDSSTAAITSREVNGRPAVEAQLHSPGDTWMGPEGPVAQRNLLTMRTQVMPVLYQGQGAEVRVVVEIHEDQVAAADDDDVWRSIEEEWGHELLDDHRRKLDTKSRHGDELLDAQALALELLANKRPLNFVSLKQFRDAEDPDLACYQAIVLVHRVVDELFDLQEMDEQIHVRICDYPDHPISRTLGLKAMKCEVEEGQYVETFEPIRPFWMKANLRESLGRDLCWRAGSRSWRGYTPGRTYFSEEDQAGVGRDLVAEIDDEKIPLGTEDYDAKRARLRAAVRDWQEGAGRRLTRSEAEAAVEKIEPQMVIESLLSHEWGHEGESRWREKRRQETGAAEDPPAESASTKSRRGPRYLAELGQKPDFFVRFDSVGPAAERLFGRDRAAAGEWYSEEGLAKRTKKGKGPRPEATPRDREPES